MPHGWDAGLFFDETERTLFCSDLFFQGGNPEPLIESGIAELARAAIQGNLAGPLANDLPYTAQTDGVLRRLAALDPRILAIMHGSSFRGDGRKAIEELSTSIRELLA